MADALLLDSIKHGFDLKNDAQLADFLGVTRASIHTVRFDPDRQIGPKARFLVIDRIAFLRTDDMPGQWVKSVRDRELIDLMIRNSDFDTRKRAKAHSKPEGQGSTAKELIEMAKIVLDCRTDDDLAAILEVARNTISSLRTGKTSLGLIPRLILLNQLEKFDLDRVKLLVDSADDLAQEVRLWKQRQVG